MDLENLHNRTEGGEGATPELEDAAMEALLKIVQSGGTLTPAQEQMLRDFAKEVSDAIADLDK